MGFLVVEQLGDDNWQVVYVQLAAICYCSLPLWSYIIVIILLLLLFLWYCSFLFLRIPKGEKSRIAQQQFLSATIQEKITPVFV